MRYLLSGIGLLTLAGSIVSSPALADQNLDCDAYAAAAIKQQVENQVKKCGFQGLGWSSNYQEHKAWCQLDIVKMKDLTTSHNFRATALKQCEAQKAQPEPGPQFKPVVSPQLGVACGKYAVLARKQNQENRAHDCGLKGGAWSDDVNGHRAWCMKASSTARTHQAQLRRNAIQNCTTVKVFNNPKGRKVKGRRWPLDQCDSSQRVFCGEIIARNFCRQQGFNKVTESPARA